MGSKELNSRWAFRPDNNKASAWLNLIYNEDDFYKYSVIFQSGDNTKLEVLRKELINLQFKKSGSFNIDGKITSYYNSNNHEVTLTIFTQKDEGEFTNETQNFYTIEVKKQPTSQEKAKFEKKKKQDRIESEFFSLLAESLMLSEVVEMADSNDSYEEYNNLKAKENSLNNQILSLQKTTVIRQVKLKEKPSLESKDKLGYDKKTITLNQGDTVRIYNDKIYDSYVLVCTSEYEYGYLKKGDLKLYAIENKPTKPLPKKK